MRRTGRTSKNILKAITMALYGYNVVYISYNMNHRFLIESLVKRVLDSLPCADFIEKEFKTKIIFKNGGSINFIHRNELRSAGHYNSAKEVLIFDENA